MEPAKNFYRLQVLKGFGCRFDQLLPTGEVTGDKVVMNFPEMTFLDPLTRNIITWWPGLWISSPKNENLGILKLLVEMWKIGGNLAKVSQN